MLPDTLKHDKEMRFFDVSVIIPYHYDRGFLVDAIESYENQIFSGTSELIISHGPDKSLGENFNDGIRMAKGKYVKILPEDDLLTPNCLQDLFDSAEENNADLVFAQARNFAGAGVEKISKSPPVILDMTLQALIDNNFIHAITTLYRTEMLQKLEGFDESMWTAEEYEFHLRCLALGYKPYFVPTIVCEYREWEGSKSRVYRLQRKEERLQYIEQIKDNFRSQVEE
jgi:GT2 family glycosyltransferase